MIYKDMTWVKSESVRLSLASSCDCTF